MIPQLNEGGKFIFGISFVNWDNSVHIPPQAVQEYAISTEGKVLLVSGSKKTGGFIVTRKGLLYNSRIGNILKDRPALGNYALPEGNFVQYKGRLYCWTNVTGNGTLVFTDEMLGVLDIAIGTKLLVIRGSDIAFAMGAKGPLLERAGRYPGKVEIY